MPAQIPRRAHQGPDRVADGHPAWSLAVGAGTEVGLPLGTGGLLARGRTPDPGKWCDGYADFRSAPAQEDPTAAANSTEYMPYCVFVSGEHHVSKATEIPVRG